MELILSALTYSRDQSRHFGDKNALVAVYSSPMSIFETLLALNMPPIRSASGRASKACDLCRKCRTRCYTSQGREGSCLRCTTLSQSCSLTGGRRSASGECIQEFASSRGDIVNGGVSDSLQQPASVDDRYCCSRCVSGRPMINSMLDSFD